MPRSYLESLRMPNQTEIVANGLFVRCAKKKCKAFLNGWKNIMNYVPLLRTDKRNADLDVDDPITSTDFGTNNRASSEQPSKKQKRTFATRYKPITVSLTIDSDVVFTSASYA